MSRALSLPWFPVALIVILAVATIGRGAAPADADTPVYADGAGGCNGLTPCFTTIQEAVNNAGPAPAEVFVFPGTYAETVDLGLMGSDIAGSAGDLALTTVNASGAPAPGTATISPASGEPIFAFSFPGALTIDGFVATSADDTAIDVDVDGDLAIANVTANNNAAGDGVVAHSNAGDVTVTNVTANGNSSDGLDVEGSGNLTITNSTANDNGGNGFEIDVGGDVAVSGSSADGNEDEGFDINGVEGGAAGDVTINGSSASGTTDDDGFEIDAASVAVSNSTANDNSDEGFDIVSSGAVTLDRVTAIGNGEDGIDVEGQFIDEGGPSAGNVTIRNSNLQDNANAGVEVLESGTSAGTLLVNGNIICGNTISGLALLTDASVNAEGNWWGAASGPTHLSNGAGTGDAVMDAANPDPVFAEGTVDFDPWVDTITGSADPAVAGSDSAVSFQFSDAAATVFLGDGPGDPAGPPFTLTTDNGTLTSSTGTGATVTESINNPDGTLEVTLTPDTAGSATVTVTGPCGLDDSLGGSIVLNVAAAPSQATPTPTPAALPPTGATPSSSGGNSGLAIALAIGALAVLGAGAWALRRRLA